MVDLNKTLGLEDYINQDFGMSLEDLTIPAISAYASPTVSESLFSSNPLNVARKSVSGRYIRSPLTESAFIKGQPLGLRSTPTQLSGFTPTKTNESVEGLAGFTPGPDTGDVPGGLVGTEIGNAIASQLGVIGAGGMLGSLPAAIAASQSGLPTSSVIGGVLGSGVTTALAPGALANAVAGGLIAGHLGQTGAEEAVEKGFSLSDEGKGFVAAQGTEAALSPFGAVGMGTRGLASVTPGLNVSSPSELATQAAIQSAKDIQTFMAPQHMATPGDLGLGGPTGPGGSVGPEGTPGFAGMSSGTGGGGEK